MSFEGKVIAITGAASGIGLAAAQILSGKGAIICLCDVDPEAMSKTEEHFSQLKAQFSMTTVDVSDKQQVESWIHGIVERYGRLDGAVNNAGIIGKHHGLRAVAHLEDDEWHKIIAVNLTGTMYCMRAQLRAIVDGGSIVNLSSIHGLQGFAMHGAYDASKHGVLGLTRAAAKENGAREIRVNAVAPGSIHTPLMDKSFAFHGRSPDEPFDDTAAFGRHGTATEVANVIVFLLSPESRYVSGSVYSVDGAMT